jgi:LCP family protein required for cell wall assembly
MRPRPFGWLIPKTRLGTAWRMLLAAVIFIGCGAGVTATAGLLEVNTFVGYINVNPGFKSKQLVLPAPGKPETLLLIGSDHRYGDSFKDANTDTLLLVRLNAGSRTINMMSIPRDLQVDVPGYGVEKINAAYSQGAYSLLLKTIKQNVFPKLKVTHIIDTNFTGFSDIIDALGCVYSPVDHRYYNVSEPGVDDFSAINIEPGYQKLCGHNQSVKGALAFVRFRHTDTDLVREARQQDFIRWAKDQFSASELLSKRAQLFKIFGHNSTTDKDLHSDDGLLDLFHLVVDSDARSIKQIPFPASFDNTADADYVTSTPSAEAQAFAEFMKPTTASAAKPAKVSHPSSGAGHKGKGKKAGAKLNTAGLTSDPQDGIDQAKALPNPGMPVYYPKYIVSPVVSTAFDWEPEYCFSSTADCDSSIEPQTAYEGSYPRQYRVPVRGADGTFAKAYVMTVQLNGALDSYYNIQGIAWKNPPLLNDPSETKVVHGRKLYLYAAGGKLTTVAWHLGKYSYWIQNDLTSDIPNQELVALAASMVRYRG